jgi:hypothetical protein
MYRLLLAALALILSTAAVEAQDKKAPDAVTATLVAKTTTYKLDLGGMTADEYRKMLKDAEISGKVPPPPAIEMTLELKNNTDEDVQVWISGSPVVLDLHLKGDGAVSLKPRVAFPAIFILPKPVTIAPGKTHSIPVTSLKYGFRGASNMAYWTEPGDYTLSASLKTGISPAPKDSKEKRDGFGVVTLATEPVKLKIEAK